MSSGKLNSSYLGRGLSFLLSLNASIQVGVLLIYSKNGINYGHFSEINECQSSPCINGNCVDKVNGFTCNCHPGFYGKLCSNGKFSIQNEFLMIWFIMIYCRGRISLSMKVIKQRPESRTRQFLYNHKPRYYKQSLLAKFVNLNEKKT